MQILLVFALFLFARNLTGAARPDKCASRCDTSLCPSPSCPGGYVPDRCNCCLVCSPAEGDPCGRKNSLPCGDGLECKPLGPGRRRGGSKGVCRCTSQQEVCASDGRTYGNVCKMKAASRRGCTGTGSAPGPALIPLYRLYFSVLFDHLRLFSRHPLFGRHMRLSSGSGFIVTHSGVIVTNAHVVTTATTVTGRPQLRVQLHDGDAYDAMVREVDRKADIATIKVNPQKKLPVLSVGRSSDLRPGEFVVAIGSPFALQNTVTTGIVSTAQRDGKELGIKDSDMDYIQTDAIINYGNSGGPLVNLDGEVIGINTLKVTAGISFAIPSDRISRFLAESQTKHSKALESKSERDKGEIKPLIQLEFFKPETLRRFPEVSSGVLVRQVIPNTPAENGGIQEGDVIVKVNGHPVQTIDDIWEALQGHQPLLLEIRRGNDDLLFNIHPQVMTH
uniref:Serine protease HTRA2, mitochondrial n=1 Tax=Sphaeramia orbicularis TaxID=375764 RepID=A0A673B5K5_9TELE